MVVVTNAQMDDFISAYRPKEVADVVSIDTDDNNASCKQVSPATTRVRERTRWWCDKGSTVGPTRVSAV